MSNLKIEATVKATGEKVIVYKLNNGNYYDYERMGANEHPTASKAGKKEFAKDELILGIELQGV